MALRTVRYWIHITATTLSVRVRPSTKSRLEKLAKSTGRSRALLAAEAIAAYLVTNEWQVARINKALASLDRGRGITHERVSDWVASRSVLWSPPCIVQDFKLY